VTVGRVWVGGGGEGVTGLPSGCRQSYRVAINLARI
jgi:hypothetical protein